MDASGIFFQQVKKNCILLIYLLYLSSPIINLTTKIYRIKEKKGWCGRSETEELKSLDFSRDGNKGKNKTQGKTKLKIENDVSK